MAPPLQIAMVGAGALGGVFAHHLARGGAAVVVLDRWAEHVAAMQDHGLRLRIGGQDQSARLRLATTDPKEAARALPGGADMLILFTKTAATDAALAAAAPLVGPQTVLVTLQNGIGNAERMAAAYPGHPVLFGLTTLTGDVLAPGHVEARSTTAGDTDIWRLAPEDDASLAALIAALDQGGIAARAQPQILHSIWKKLAVNCALNGLCAVTGLTCGGLTGQPGIWPTLDAIADEVAAVATAKGIALDAAEARAFLRKVNAAALSHYPSMVSDIAAHRPTEIPTLNEAVTREGARLGIPTPANALVTALVRAVEAKTGAPHV